MHPAITPGHRLLRVPSPSRLKSPYITAVSPYALAAFLLLFNVSLATGLAVGVGFGAGRAAMILVEVLERRQAGLG